MFFDILGAKELKVGDLEQIEPQIPLTLCKLEKAFPPAFFNVMLHLSIHLVHEAKIGGPVQFRWMYPIKQVMYTFKSFIHNRTRPDASIAEGYLADECMTLCSRYLHSMETKFNHPHRNYENQVENDGGLSIFNHPGHGLGSQRVRTDVEKHELHEAHFYILKNCNEVQPFLE